QDDAVTTLKTDGLTVVVNPIQDDSVAAGTVVRTEPAAGEQIAGGTTVTVYVAQAKMDINRTVPSLTGMTQTDAVSSLRGLNLIPSLVEQASDQPAGTVVSQSPSPGSAAQMNATIKLYVSTGISQEVLDQQAAAEAERLQQQQQADAAINGWDEQDENGNWYHVNPDGTRADG
ncbi:MAG: PASTA domain-containing protein, partial [Gemmiger sp.]|nr:PASTA domain-containing protein [Gemmiger sp.]